MTAVLRRYRAYRAAAFAVATIAQLQGTVSGPTLVLTTAPAPTVTVFRAPLITRWAKRRHPVDLLTIAPPSFMARGPLSTQLRGGDWPNPRGRQHPYSLRTWIHDSIRTSVSSPPVPAQQASPNPLRPTYPISLLTWTQNLLQTTLLPVAATPPVGERVDVVPIGPRYNVALRTFAIYLQQTTLVPPPEPIPDGRAIPNWPNPLGYAYPIAIRGFVLAPTQELLASPPPPSLAGDVVDEGDMIIVLLTDGDMLVVLADDADMTFL